MDAATNAMLWFTMAFFFVALPALGVVCIVARGVREARERRRIQRILER